MNKEYKTFIDRFQLLIKKNPELILVTLSNIFSTRLIGNKTHGDLTEIAISEFINQYMYDFKSKHVGKELYRSKSKEEDILVKNEITGKKFPVSLKAYGIGPLQLSTDPESKMFSLLKSKKQKKIKNKKEIENLVKNKIFTSFSGINLLPLIYEEKKKKCNILVFDFKKALDSVSSIEYIKEGKGRKYPIFRFFDSKKAYIFEVRYGGKDANALQRGLWSNTKTGIPYFQSLTGGWITYKHNKTLVELFSKILISREKSHKLAKKTIQSDINKLKDLK